MEVNTGTAEIGRVAYKKIGLIQKLRGFLKYIGPAFIVSVAYIDPGNFATNISGGSKFKYELIWVILCSNLMAIFLQTLSAKLGIATGCSLPEMCSKVFSKKANWTFWVIAEIGAMATDLAEFLGGTLGLHLLFNIPMIYAAFITGIFTFLIVYMEKYGQKIVEIIIATFVAVIGVSYIFELFLAKPQWGQVAVHSVMPQISSGDALLIAVGMLGATVMPHVIYLHSHLVQHRRKDFSEQDKKLHLKMEKLDIVLAMNIAFIVNAAMVIVSAAVFFNNGIVVDTIEQAQNSLKPLLGELSSGAFGIALIAAGFSSSAVGTMAGQTIMKGFVNLSIPVNLRRIITMAPAIIIIALGVNPMNALIISQVALSFILPFPILQLLKITNRQDLMGSLVNKKSVKNIGMIIAGIIISLNIVLLYLTIFK
ncbi:Nramp family divalent metal transporter [Clostridium sp. 'White wine YQ']|uniref:Nramp family divalent metal transporter n=1 Tax=Clostridium sp. 'White wine YQ' TaxID=3027474 RepID=UPI002365D8E1|nr:Nramp family divalent metal transporter [Clostridium sp. 'White wine YQ']MDD7794066.1 Nramp family divalent metal transporter [Clostridium sp. 'White wine YQ']